MLRTVALLLIASVLVGCINDLVGLFPGNQPIPSETVAELAVRGASLGSTNSRHDPLPDDIGASVWPVNPRMLYSGELTILILPDDSLKANRNGERFFYAFSKHVGDDVYELLLNQRYAVDDVPVTTFVELFVSDVLPSGTESLSGIADFHLEDSPFFLPMDATHMELYFLPEESPDDHPVFVKRWTLTGFYGYDRYLQPLIVGSESQTP